MDTDIDRWARIVWEYHHLHHVLKPAECLLVLGSHDVRVAMYAADLFLQGYAPLIVFSGGFGNFTQGVFEKPEAELFADIAAKRGVPRENMLIENRSTNTGDNIRLTRALLAEKGLDPKTVILVQKPYMERRTYATFKKLWPEKVCIVTSPPMTFDDYPNQEISKERMIEIMVGDLQRIKRYPAKGFQIPQDIPAHVWDAYEHLVANGYTGHLLKEAE